MPATPSIMYLHLHYRLWIAELNSDINVLRIFDDYLNELESKKNIPEVKTAIFQFKQLFISLRKEIDELRHEMHLIKMKLAAAARDNKPPDTKTSSANNHKTLKNRYTAFKKTFNKVKKEFGSFESKWLD
ncbi:MAG: hypothetical protein ACXWWC_11310 [Chitinophagaceae bacterium]